ncbi:septal ring lytic transglycosylase RlpA family protein [Porphyrobacter sp. GA68]|uniref:septal ring lytic transglycosylase RlpA family protein n=1 Tax=Porphyrobacter sp. GA68 TaxID=2883480 RepID=UPI001D186DA1|nr:septal ring lytic transglycosylase RlpA family protein [Porphyrobacter sp. GA68]
MTKRTLRLCALATILATSATAGWSASTPDNGVPAGELTAPSATPLAAPAAPAEEAPAEEAPAEEATLIGTGTASFYASEFHGRRTASGARFDMNAMTAAHRTLPFGTRLRVTNERNGRSVVVTVNDRGPFHKSRVLDVSRAAAERLNMVGAGSARVRLERVG